MGRIFATSGTQNLLAYSGGYLKFSIKVNASRAMKVELQGPQGTAKYVNITPTAGSWQHLTIPLSSFSGINLQQVYALFSITSPGGLATTYLVDNVQWSKTP